MNSQYQAGKQNNMDLLHKTKIPTGETNKSEYINNLLHKITNLKSRHRSFH